MPRAKDLAVDALERAANGKGRQADEAAEPSGLLAERDALTECARVFRELPDDHPAVIGLESMLYKARGDEGKFISDWARMVRRQTGIHLGGA
jgi:hypothetical protein